MSLDKNAISSHMRRLGLGALAHATHHAMYYSMDNELHKNQETLEVIIANLSSYFQRPPGGVVARLTKLKLISEED